MHLSIIIPADLDPLRVYKLLLFNDGQDFAELQINRELNLLYAEKKIEEVIVVGIHANHNRIQEYGTAVRADYAGRGAFAGATTKFVIHELLPFLVRHYPIRDQGNIYAGCSLGGLMALDIAWHHPHYFSKVAVFSGALWWRGKAVGYGYENSDRIMHAQIRESYSVPALKFWFQTGTHDETDDRDGDGVIDSIQDTLECISELERKGYGWGHDICYLEVQDGKHDTSTWSAVLPLFCQWALGIRADTAF